MGAINNPGANTVHEGVKATGANSVVFGLDMYSAGPPPSGNFYVTEDGASFYVTEDGLNNYVTES